MSDPFYRPDSHGIYGRLSDLFNQDHPLRPVADLLSTPQPTRMASLASLCHGSDTKVAVWFNASTGAPWIKVTGPGGNWLLQCDEQGIAEGLAR
jgi:hypothetical protein